MTQRQSDAATARHLARRLHAAETTFPEGVAFPVMLTGGQVRVLAQALSLLTEHPVGWRAVPLASTDAMVEAYDRAVLTYAGHTSTHDEVRRMKRHALAQAIAASPAAYFGDSGPDRIRHLKRGSTYDVFCRTGEVQASAPIFDGDTLVTYVCAKTGKVWHRPPHEIADPARFEVIEPQDDAA